MAYTKKSPSSSKSVHTAELTTGQLVLAVCTFLIVVLGVFLLGIIVGEYQYKIRESKAGAADAVTPATDTAKGEGVQPNNYPVREAMRGPKTVAPPPEAFRSREQSGPSTTTVAAPPPRTEQPAPVDPPVPATPAPETPAPAAPTDTTPAVPIPLEPIEAEDVVADADLANEGGADQPDEPVEMLPVEPAAPAATASVPSGKYYSVQVAALSDPKNADVIKKKIESTSTWPVDIEPNASKKLQVVYVGRFSTLSEAEKARDELRKRPEFSKAFISARSS